MKKNKKVKRKTKLKTQIVIMLIFAIMIPVAAVTGYSEYNTEKGLTAQAEKDSFNNLKWVSDTIGEIYRENSESASMLSEDPNAKAIFVDESSATWLMKSFEAFADTHKSVKSIFYGLKDGKMLLEPSETLPADYDPRQRPWYKAAMEKEGQVIVTNPYEDASQKGTFVITFARSVKNAENGQVEGVVGLDIKISTLSDLVKNIKIGNEGYVALLDSEGTIISHKDAEMLGKGVKEASWVEGILKSGKANGSYLIKGENYLTYSVTEKNTGWKIVAFTPEKEITTTIIKDRIVSLVIALVLIILAALGGTIFSNSLTKPINKLVGALDRIKEGDFTVSIPSFKRVSYEVDVIAISLNNMKEDMVEVLKSILDTSKGMKESSESLVSITEQSSAVGEEVSKAVQEISEGAQNQASSLDVSTAVVGRLGEEVNKVVENSSGMLIASENVKKSTLEGTKVVENLKAGFKESSTANKELEEGIKELSESSNKISAITDTIKSITAQTSLLALNASIEAARAGEAGRGFAVVAEEVRKLSEESSSSAGDINKVINDIKASVSSVLNKIQLSITLNEKSEQNVEVTNSSFKNIEEAISLLEKNIEAVTNSLMTIDSSKEEVVQKISEIATVAQETAATTEEVSASSEEQTAALLEVVGSAESLSELAEKMDEMVKKFKI